MKKVFRLPFVLIVLLAGLAPLAALAQESNLLGDAGFELSTPNGSFPDSGYWSPAWLYQAGSLCTTTASYSGNNGLWTYTGDDGSSWWVGPWQQYPVVASYGYRGSAWARGIAWTTGARALVRISFMDSSGFGVLKSYESPALVSADQNWAKYEVLTPPAPSGAGYVRLTLYLEKPNGSAGQAIMNFDDAWLSAVPLQPVVMNIVVEPAGTCVPIGSAVTLTANAGGTPPLGYQWRRAGFNLAGETGSTLHLTGISTNDGGSYDIIVTNLAGGTTSASVNLIICEALRPVLLSVSPPPNAQTVPANATIRARYSLPMLSGSVSPLTLAIHPSLSRASTNLAAFSVSGGTVSYSNSLPFKAGELVEVTATTGLLATNMAGPADSFVWQFQVAATQGTGLFTDSEQQIPRAAQWSSSVVFGDVNGDGYVDALVNDMDPSGYNTTTEVLLNDGAGHLTNLVQTLNHWLMDGSAQLRDLNGDGTLDFFLAGAPGFAVYFNDGSGRFAQSNQGLLSGQGCVNLADINGDGSLDGGTVLINDGKGNFTPGQQGLGAEVTAVADLNGDGKPDLVLGGSISSGFPTNMAIWFNDGFGHFTNSGQSIGYAIRSLAVGDVNGDGYSDILVATGSDSWSVAVWTNNGRGHFANSGQHLAAGSALDVVALGDVNHDGYLDAIISVAPGLTFPTYLQVYLNDGHGQFLAGQRLPTASQDLVKTATLVDLRHEGALDLFVRTYNDNLKVYFNQLAAPQLVTDFVPPIGSHDTLKGHLVGGVPSGMAIYAAIFLEGLGWFPKPTDVNPLTPIQPDGSFEINLTTGGVDPTATIIRLWLVGDTFSVSFPMPAECPPPELDRAAFTAMNVYRTGPSQRAIPFSGCSWRCKANTVPLGPGPNYFSDDPTNACVDAQGRLHLRIVNQGGKWSCPELISDRTFGYGTYIWQIDSASVIDPNAVFGMFTWSDTCPYAHREMDIELSQWGATTPTNAQFVVQPWSSPNHRYQSAIASGTIPTTHRFLWLSNQVSFLTLQGAYAGPPAPADIIAQWTFPDPNAVPPSGDEKVHINLWLIGGNPPASGQEVEVIVSRFVFASANAPELWVESSLNEVSIRWLMEYTGYSLERASSVAGPWNAVDIVPTSEPPYNRTVLPLQTGARFFRLRK